MDVPEREPSAPVRPLDVDGVGAVALGTVAWAVALVVTVLARDGLESSGRGWWIWVCVAGTALGLLGLPYVLRRRSAYRSASSEPAASGTSTSATEPSD